MNEILFSSPEEFYDFIENGNDIYNIDTQEYAFAYNDIGSICVYYIDHKEAQSLSRKEEYWDAYLGMGGSIFDDPDRYDYDEDEDVEAYTVFDYVKEVYNEGTWVLCDDVPVKGKLTISGAITPKDVYQKAA